METGQVVAKDVLIGWKSSEDVVRKLIILLKMNEIVKKKG